RDEGHVALAGRHWLGLLRRVHQAQGVVERDGGPAGVEHGVELLLLVLSEARPARAVLLRPPAALVGGAAGFAQLPQEFDSGLALVAIGRRQQTVGTRQRRFVLL